MVRGEIWWADLPDPTGSEMAYSRPVLIVQADQFNQSRLDTAVVVPLTSNLDHAHLPGNLKLLKSESGLSRDSVVNLTLVTAINKAQLTERCGAVDDALMVAVDSGLRLVLDL